MNIFKKSIVVVAILMFSISSILSQSTQSSEIEIGTISGEQEAGQAYDLYRSSADSFAEYLAGWTYVGEKDRRVDYSDNQIYEKCLEKAKERYGR